MSTSLSQEPDRVRRHTLPDINERIDADIDITLRRYTGAIRAKGEIDCEKYILKALRGDFEGYLKSHKGDNHAS